MSLASGCRRLFSVTLNGSFCQREVGACVPAKCSHSWIITRPHNGHNQYLPQLPTLIQTRDVKSKAGATKKKKVSESKEMPPLDPTVCSGVNILKAGNDPALKQDSEYPEWLWGLMDVAGPPRKPSELPEGSKEYWKRYNKTKSHERNELQRQLS